MYQIDLKAFTKDLQNLDCFDSDALNFMKEDGWSEEQINMCKSFFKLGVAFAKQYALRNIKEVNDEK